MQLTLFTFSAWVLSVSHPAAAREYPLLTCDPNTIKSCIYYYDNRGGQKCETVRKNYGISPENFHRWNPSISVTCEGWTYQSYCVAVNEEQGSLSVPPVTSTTASSTTTSRTRSIVWTDQSCYADASLHPLQTQLPSPAGADLSRRKCENACWKAEYAFAALKAGVECWCGDYVNGFWTDTQDACNIPCPGNRSETCGGDNAFNVLEGNRADEFFTTSALGTPTYTTEANPSGVFPSNFFPSGVDPSDVFGTQAPNTASAGPSETSKSSAVNRLSVPFPVMGLIGGLGLVFAH